MKPETYINKIQPDPEGLDFKGLREEGIKAVQELSGDIWTDYNLHDPGVTLLEALCYALTDLVYRAGFDAEDYLVAGNGKIDFNKQALFRPDEILSCRPLTDNDYRKLVLDSDPDIDNVWIEWHSDKPGEIPGLCRLSVLLSEHVRDQCNDGVRREYVNRIESVYSANRNLCEDLAEVRIVDRLQYSLAGEIEIEGKRNPANILAEIYFESAQYLSPKVAFHSYRDMYAQGSSLEDLFTGVLTANGYIADSELHEWRGQFSISELIGIIGQIEGVKNVDGLLFVDSKGKEDEYIDIGNGQSFISAVCLQRSLTDVGGITLHREDKVYQILPQDVETEYRRLEYKFQALRYQKNRFDWVGATLPAATFRNLGDYFSIQNHFPAVYGVNAYGVPDSYPAKRKAQAMQLKAYLLLFEQLMANFLQNAQGIKMLFSLDEQLKQSYFFRVLQNNEVPKAEEIYFGDIKNMAAAMSRRLAQHDNHADRRNRVLDYLLGIYGETFNQRSLRHFFAEGADTAEALIRNKREFLKDIEDIGKNRAAAFDYRKPSDGDNNCSGLKNKLKLLLGLKLGEIAPAAIVVGDVNQARDSIQIVEHILLRPIGKPSHNGIKIDDNFYGSRMSIIFHSMPDMISSMEFRKLAEQTIYMNCPAHIHPEIFWLESGAMDDFNKLHEMWLETKCTTGFNAAIINAAAERLITFLLDIRKGKRE